MKRVSKANNDLLYVTRLCFRALTTTTVMTQTTKTTDHVYLTEVTTSRTHDASRKST